MATRAEAWVTRCSGLIILTISDIITSFSLGSLTEPTTSPSPVMLRKVGGILELCHC